MSLCIMERYISETWPPILMKLGMKFTHILIVNRGKFHLISPINRNFSLINIYKRLRLREHQKRYIFETWPPILIKLGMKFTHILIVNRGKFHRNWWSGFRDIAFHDTEGHSFIIIRIVYNLHCASKLKNIDLHILHLETPQRYFVDKTSVTQSLICRYETEHL